MEQRMAKPLLDDGLWQIIEPLLPAAKPRRYRHPGRKPISDRQTLTGILFVLKTGIDWEDLPQEMGCGSGMTCWRPTGRLASRGSVAALACGLAGALAGCRPDQLVAGRG
jgi:transposase